MLVSDDATGLLRVLDAMQSGRGHSVTCVDEAELFHQLEYQAKPSL